MCGRPGRRRTALASPPLRAPSACCGALQDLVDSYGGDTHRLPTDVADVIGASIAYVDRPTVEAHLERPLSDREWAATAQSSRPWPSTTTSETPASATPALSTGKPSSERSRRRVQRAQGRVRRDCTHPRARHMHGTRVAYVKDRRRCTNCTAANTATGRAAPRDGVPHRPPLPGSFAGGPCGTVSAWHAPGLRRSRRRFLHRYREGDCDRVVLFDCRHPCLRWVDDDQELALVASVGRNWASPALARGSCCCGIVSARGLRNQR